MRILHINCNYMGTKLHQTMIEHLNPYVKENKVFCPIYSGSQLVTNPNSNVLVSRCFNAMDRAFFLMKSKKITTSVQKQVDILEFDCIHAYTLFTDGNCALECKKKYRIPYIVAIRATDFLFFKYRINLRKRGINILKHASYIIFLADNSKERFIRKYVPKRFQNEIINKTVVIPNGIDDFWLHNKYYRVNEDNKFRNKQITLCCVAQIIKRKNIPNICEAMEILKSQGWRIELQVIGKIIDKKEYNKIANHSEISYISPLKKEKLINRYREADIFVLPSKGETFGLVYAEAMSQGLPVIYSKDEGFDGQFQEGVVGYHVNPKDPKSIANAIIQVCDKYNLLSKNATKLSDKFDWNNIIQSYLKIYSTL
ncbi:MAG TPA: glycosyltransferase family 4 protein [Candidatus Mediterraneibacter surreyensis]|nr:glycosyltransferase family 4 protein [Candidatus Mediterraneibacter surreyensis]